MKPAGTVNQGNPVKSPVRYEGPNAIEKPTNKPAAMPMVTVNIASTTDKTT